MCGRAKLTVPFSVLAKLYSLEPPERELPPQVEIRPTNPMAVVRVREGTRRLDVVRWGLVPSWAKDLKFGAKCINARAETVATSPAFRAAFRKRRCLVPVDGFYEWPVDEHGKKVPHLIHQPDHAPFSLAGLWESWASPDGEVIETCTILTVPAKGAMARIHDRMPLILGPDHFDTWLDPAQSNPSALLTQGEFETLTFEPTTLLARKVS